MEIALTDKLRYKLAELGEPLGDVSPEVIAAAAIRFKKLLGLTNGELKRLRSLSKD